MQLAVPSSEKRNIFMETKNKRRKVMNGRKKGERMLISFDYALKRLLRNKANLKQHKPNSL
jgi:hypothetical protein